jgi:N-ATPase, AtpR subunit
MTHHQFAAALEATAALGLGATLGLVYFACLRKTVTLFAADGGWAGPAMLTVGRFVAAAAAFALAARLGAVPLLSGFAGFVLSRGIALRRVRSAG